MKKITIANIKKVKNHKRQRWHDAGWWAVELSGEVFDAISYALDCKMPYDTKQDTQNSAKKWLQAIKGQK